MFVKLQRPAAGNQDFLTDTLRAFQYGDAAPALARFDGAHQPGGPAAEHDYVKRLARHGSARNDFSWPYIVISGCRTRARYSYVAPGGAMCSE